MTTNTAAQSHRPVAPPARRPLPRPAAAPHGLGFTLFMVVNAALFLRPSDVIRSIQGFELFQFLILGCFAVSFPAVLEKLSSKRLDEQPFTLCVLLQLPAIVFSSMLNSDLFTAWENAISYSKIIVYYLLFVSLVTTPGRLRTFLTWFIIFAAGVTLLSVLDFHKVFRLPRPVSTNGRSLPIDFDRMVGPGIFLDPNDVCLLIVVAATLLIGRLLEPGKNPLRILWLPLLGLLAYGFFCTQSRGGLLALVGGMGILIRLRYGWKRAFFIGALGLPVLVAMLGGRQTDISTNVNTGQGRIELWAEGIRMIKQSPLWGIGLNRYGEEASHVAHNSYLQFLAELGIVGGMFYLGAFVYALKALYQLVMPISPREKTPRTILDPQLRILHPAVTGSLVAYCVGMLTLTLNLMMPTYAMLGVAAVFAPLAVTRPATPPDRFDAQLLLRFLGIAIVYLAGMYVFVAVFLRV